MELKTIAEELVAGCREGREVSNLDRLYAPDAISVEAMPMPGTDSAETRGVEGIKGKHAWWAANVEVLEAKVEGPFVHGNDSFAVIFEIHSRNRQSGEEGRMKEVAVYTVNGGKIVREAFYYSV